MRESHKQMFERIRDNPKCRDCSYCNDRNQKQGEERNEN